MKKAEGRRFILGYADRLTVRPGEEIDFKVSAENGSVYQAQLVRLINGDIHSDQAGFREVELDSSVNGRYCAKYQPIYPGSCGAVENSEFLGKLDEFTLAFSAMPTMPGKRAQHLISHWYEGMGWFIQIDEEARLSFQVADRQGRGQITRLNDVLREKTWVDIALRVSFLTQTVTLECYPRAKNYSPIVSPGSRTTSEYPIKKASLSCPLMFAAAFGGRDKLARPIPVRCFNGRLERPAIYRGLLSDAELACVIEGKRPHSLRHRLVADWDFSRTIGTTVIKDRSANRLNGFTHNLPLRGVKGVQWDRSEFNWNHKPEHYAAIHFHDDDLYDCGWETDFTYRIPDGLRSSIYALRLRLEGAEEEEVSVRSTPRLEEYVPFFVAAPKGKPQSNVAFIVPTYTYLAYANHKLLERGREKAGLAVEEFYAPSNLMCFPGAEAYGLLASAHPDVGLSTYDRHSDGSPSHFSSWLRPILNMRPKSNLWGLCADLLFIDWLEAKGFAYDIITDDLLETEGVRLLNDYRVVMTGNHPEYPTSGQLEAIETYLYQGGRFMYMGGNGYYWRSGVHRILPGVIEVRRGRVGTGMWQSDIGEDYLETTGELGGIWRDIGRPPQQLFGVGFVAQGGVTGAPYRITPEARTDRAAFILEGIEGDVIGDFGIFGGGAAGQEIDQTNREYGTPDHAVVLARSENHDSAMLYVIEEMENAYPDFEAHRKATRAELTFFETQAGGAVFSTGSMSWCGSLGYNNYDNTVSTITENVLRRFCDPKRFGVNSDSK